MTKTDCMIYNERLRCGDPYDPHIMDLEGNRVPKVQPNRVETISNVWTMQSYNIIIIEYKVSTKRNIKSTLILIVQIKTNKLQFIVILNLYIAYIIWNMMKNIGTREYGLKIELNLSWYGQKMNQYKVSTNKNIKSTLLLIVQIKTNKLQFIVTINLYRAYIIWNRMKNIGTREFGLKIELDLCWYGQTMNQHNPTQ